MTPKKLLDTILNEINACEQQLAGLKQQKIKLVADNPELQIKQLSEGPTMDKARQKQAAKKEERRRQIGAW